MTELDTCWHSLVAREIKAPDGSVVVSAYRDARITYPVYKAVKREHALSFFRSGSLRVGTLYDFRREEHASGIADAQEGMHSSTGAHDGVIFQASVQARDGYIFSVSEDCDTNRFNGAGYDAVYRIDSPLFFDEIAKVLAKQMMMFPPMIAKVIYEEPAAINEDISRRLTAGSSEEEALPPTAFLKRPSEAYQREVRFYMEPQVDPIIGLYPDPAEHNVDSILAAYRSIKSTLLPVTLKVPDARRYASKVRSR